MMIMVPPTTLAIDWMSYPDAVTPENAKRIWDLFSVDPVVIHEDTVLENEQLVLAAMYLGISALPVIYLDSVEDYIPNEALEYAGPSNDA